MNRFIVDCYVQIVMFNSFMFNSYVQIVIKKDDQIYRKKRTMHAILYTTPQSFSILN